MTPLGNTLIFSKKQIYEQLVFKMYFIKKILGLNHCVTGNNIKLKTKEI